ncbi:putative small nuclear ribonucleoprotein F [Apostasia shenzhenica]|uniref:Putative small nuclear ribonucleoprotein F n=1 Tax=Apostasia shenzhenica TaxID=1088818 RepID=A0A2I0AH25_9ASPA|nr:putative small nuclear ribonucleoprotein F [Apostasia shenzhenica]
MSSGSGGEKGASGGSVKTPADFLKSIRGRPVVVKLNSGVDYRGPLSAPFLGFCILACLDGYMNIAMEQTEEYVNGQLKNKYGDAFIRGNNGRSSDNVPSCTIATADFY